MTDVIPNGSILKQKCQGRVKSDLGDCGTYQNSEFASNFVKTLPKSTVLVTVLRLETEGVLV